MDFTFTITGDETSPVLAALLSALQPSINYDAMPVKKPKKVTAKEPESEAQETPAETTAAPVEVGIKIEDVRAEATKVSQSGKRAELKAILTEMGADSLGKLKPSDYATFLEKIKLV